MVVSNGIDDMNDIEVVTWEQALEVASRSLDETRRKLSVVTDRFTWDTGSDEDRDEMRNLEFSVNIRKCILGHYPGNK